MCSCFAAFAHATRSLSPASIGSFFSRSVMRPDVVHMGVWHMCAAKGLMCVRGDAMRCGRQYPPGIRLFHNDCRTHTDLLVAHLTGVQGVLGTL